MIIKQIRLSQQSKDKLSRLKGKTGIKNWNILCRWALCYSLQEKTIPTDVAIAADSNLESDDETVAKYFTLNLERGIGYLSGTGFIKSVEDLLKLAVKERE